MDKELAQIESVLRDEIAAHQRLLSLLQRKLAALRRADQKSVTAICQQENQEVQQIADLAKQRMTLAAALTQMVDPAAGEPMRLMELCQRLPEPARGRLLLLRQQLVAQMDQVRADSGVARRAAESLLSHMHGLVQSIGSVVTQVTTYGRTGALPRAATAMSTFTTTA